MRKSRAETAQTRAHIIAGASAMLRECGLGGVSVASLMADAGLTHGGFYAHFESREALVAEAIHFALVQSAQRIYLSELNEGRKPGFSRLIRRYLSTDHRDNPRNGCALAALGGEVARDGASARTVFSAGLDRLTTLLERLSPERTRAARRAHVLSVISALSGALMLARAVNDPELSRAILAAVRVALLADEARRKQAHSSASTKSAGKSKTGTTGNSMSASDRPTSR